MFIKYKINIFRSFKRIKRSFAEILECWSHCFLVFIIVERWGKLSEIKLMTSLLVSSRNAGNLKLFWFQILSEFQRKTTQNPSLHFQVHSGSKTWKRMAYRNEKRMLYALEAFARFYKTLTEDSFEQNPQWVSLKPGRLALKKTRYRRFVTSLWKVPSPQLDKQTTKNKRMMLSEQRANSSAIILSKIRFVFRSKTFSTNDSLTQKRSIVQDINDITKQSYGSMHSFH